MGLGCKVKKCLRQGKPESLAQAPLATSLKYLGTRPGQLGDEQGKPKQVNLTTQTN